MKIAKEENIMSVLLNTIFITKFAACIWLKILEKLETIPKEMKETCSTKTTRNIECLPFQDLVFPFIFKHLSLEQLFALRGVNKSFRLLISLYFELMKDIDLQGIKTRKPFQVVFHAKTRRKEKHENTDRDAPDTLQSLPYNTTIVNSIILSRMPMQKSMFPSSQSSDSKINHLKTLNVRGCKWFCDADLLQVIHSGAYKIQVLDVSNCFQVRMKDVKFVVTKKYDLILKLDWAFDAFDNSFITWSLFLSGSDLKRNANAIIILLQSKYPSSSTQRLSLGFKDNTFLYR